MKFKDYYKILGLTPAANPEDIKLAYRRLARKFHPDVSVEMGAEQKFKEIHDAYQILKDFKTRTLYNNTVRIIRPYSYAWFRAKIQGWLDQRAQTQARAYASMRATGKFSENRSFSIITTIVGLSIIFAVTSFVLIPTQFYQPHLTIQSDSPQDNTQPLARLSQQFDSQHHLLHDPNLPTLYAEAVKKATTRASYVEARQLLMDWQNLLPDHDNHRDKLWQTLLRDQQTNKRVAKLTHDNPFSMTHALEQLSTLELILGDEILQKPTVKKALLNYYLNQAVAMMQPRFIENADEGSVYSLVFTQPQKEKMFFKNTALPFVLSADLKLPLSNELLTHSIFQLPVVESTGEVTPLLQECEDHYRANRLIVGESNALTCYQQVLQRDPQNAEARGGLEKLEHHLRGKIQMALQQKKLDRAKELLANLIIVNPKSSLLAHFKKQLTILESSLSLQNKAGRLLKKCKEFYQDNLLTVGKNSALFCYREVLVQQPNNQEARLGLQTLERTFQMWIEGALQNGNLERAKNYLVTLERINPYSTALVPLQQRLSQKTQKTEIPLPPVVKSSPVKPQPSSSVKVVTKLPKAKPLKSKKKKVPPPSVCKKCNCGDILRQLSMGVKPLTSEQKAFSQTQCH